MSREINKEIFQDTERLCKTNPALKEAIKASAKGQRLILEDDEISVPSRDKYKEEAELIVSQKRSFEAAAGYKHLI